MEIPATVGPTPGVPGGLGGSGNGCGVVAWPVAMGRSLTPTGVMGSSGTAKVLQLIPVDRLPPLWNFLLACKGPGWRASPMRQARKPYQARSRRLVPGLSVRRVCHILSTHPFGCIPCVETCAMNSLRRRGSLPCADQANDQAKQLGTREATVSTSSVVAANHSARGSQAHPPISAGWTCVDLSSVRYPG